MTRFLRFSFLLACTLLVSTGIALSQTAQANDERVREDPMPSNNPADKSLATFGGGCFWCVEAVYERIEGVKIVVSGYAGGTTKNPTYQQVVSGSTGHAEVVQLEYDPDVVSYEELLELFWKAHDPTSLNRQGADVGTQYRSIILYHDDAQKKAAEKSMTEAARGFSRRIVTQLEPLEAFYAAEDYHQDYFEKNPNAAYCAFVIAPKLNRLGLLD